MSNSVAQAMKLADLPESRHSRHEAQQFSNDESIRVPSLSQCSEGSCIALAELLGCVSFPTNCNSYLQRRRRELSDTANILQEHSHLSPGSISLTSMPLGWKSSAF